MNIFFLSMSINRCARYHFDKHVIKMILEYCQLACSAWHILNPDIVQNITQQSNCNIKLYRLTHKNHPAAKWVRAHYNNYMYVVRLGLRLCDEWRYRYQHQRTHASEPLLMWLKHNTPPNIPTYDICKTIFNPKSLSTPLPLAMPDTYKIDNNDIHHAVKSYRLYYCSDEKAHLRHWKRREVPDWLISY